MRREADIFADLSRLCTSSGYAHVIAYFCFKSNAVKYRDSITPRDFESIYSHDRLVRTEISTLIGLMIKEEIDYALPSPENLQHLIEETERLLQEVHNSMIEPVIRTIVAGLNTPTNSGEKFDPFTSGDVFREVIFYDAESAYGFQYRDFAVKKYYKDNEWLKNKRGFYIEEAKQVIDSLQSIHLQSLTMNLIEMPKMRPDTWTMLPAYIFTTNEIINQTGLERSLINTVLDAFALPQGPNNTEFNDLHDFNIINASPIIKLGEDKFLLYQMYNLHEALYESPFYWLCQDKSYFNLSMKNRGEFTEHFSKERLESVFGINKVYTNINIISENRKSAGEMDTLVVFSNRAIILQAKSKRLTLEARKGNDGILKDDFKKGIQDSYDQAWSCANLLLNTKYKLIDRNNMELNLTRNFKEIYIICVVSDQYPALNFQTRQFLKQQQSERILPPLVMDIFALDVMAEMLHSPLLFLSYINRRTLYFDKLMSANELVILSYHLQKNLWISEEFGMMLLEDDIGIDLDCAMTVRREGLPGLDTPNGILTDYKNTAIDVLLRGLEKLENSSAIELGLLLLKLSKNSLDHLNRSIDKIARRARTDHSNHDFSILISEANVGLTIHCNNMPIELAEIILQKHCHMRKYSEKSRSWFGVCLTPDSLQPRLGLELDFEWKRSAGMEKEVNEFLKNLKIMRRNRNIGRNELCPCGSGIKYKKCCGK